MLTDADNFCYLAADGFLVYAWDGSDLRVERLVAESAETTRALWSIVGSGASIVRRVYTYLPPHDPIHWFSDGKAELEVQEERWMLRLLDAPAAIPGRGFRQASARTSRSPWSTRGWTGAQARSACSVGSGSGELTPTDDSDGAVRLGPNGLAALYAGTPMYTLRGAGLAAGGDAADDALLDAVFAARPLPHRQLLRGLTGPWPG